jgi:hypothetical protein
MLYRDFSLFKKEAKQLKKHLGNTLSEIPVTLKQCQDWIAQSLPSLPDDASFNHLYLAHQKAERQLKETFSPAEVTDSVEPILGEQWVEFANIGAHKAWFSARYDRIIKVMVAHFGVTVTTYVCNAVEALWNHRVYNVSLVDRIVNSPSAPFSMMSEREWRNGVLLYGSNSKRYMAFIEKCLPKLKKEGGVLMLTPQQAELFVRLWNSDEQSEKAELTFFNATGRKDGEFLPLSSRHLYWPTIEQNMDMRHRDNELVRVIHRAGISKERSSRHDGALMWEHRSDMSTKTFYKACGDRQSVAHKPSQEFLISLANDKDVPFEIRLELNNVLKSVNADLNIPKTKTGSHHRRVKEQLEYLFSPVHDLTNTFTLLDDKAERITLSAWAEGKRVSVFILPEDDAEPWIVHQAQYLINGMLSVLAFVQVEKALSNPSSMTKGLVVGPMVTSVKGVIPECLKRHTLWGWTRWSDEHVFDERHPLFHNPVPADKSEGMAISIAPRLWTRSKFPVMHRHAHSVKDQHDMYAGWRDAQVGILE